MAEEHRVAWRSWRTRSGGTTGAAVARSCEARSEVESRRRRNLSDLGEASVISAVKAFAFRAGLGVKCGLLVFDNILQRAHAGHCDLNRISGHYWANSFGRAGRDEVARHQRHGIRDVSDDHVERKDEVTRIALLLDLAVHARFHIHAHPRVEPVSHERPHRAERVEALGAGPLAVFVLQIAGGEVIHRGVAENVRPYIFALGQFVAATCNDHAEFALVVSALRDFRPANGTSRW